MKRVDFCRKNLSSGSQFSLDKLEREIFEVPVGVWVCLDECDVCARGPYARVDRREIVKGRDAADLWRQLAERMEGGSE